MKRLLFLFGLVTAFIFLLGTSLPAHAGNTKVAVCHIPPGNPANFHTIIVSENAVPAHLAHGDLLGSCDSNAEELCNDDNPCTIDAIDSDGNCDNSQPTDCNDQNSCTVDSCDPTSGCMNDPDPNIDCQSADLCTLSVCNGTIPNDPFCEETPKMCDEGLECNPNTGNCEPPSSTGTIGDTVFEDFDGGNGMQDPGEPGLAGITVTLVCDGGVPVNQVTNANGNYLFTGIPTPATCTVSIPVNTPPSGYMFGCGGDSLIINLNGGETYLDADFCITEEGGD